MKHPAGELAPSPPKNFSVCFENKIF